MASFKLENVKIVRIGEIKEFSSGFKKVEFVVETQEQYPQTLKFEATKENADKLVKYQKIGDNVDVDFNLRGRDWEGDKGLINFTTLEAWKVFKSDGGSGSQPSGGDKGLPF
jgi:single-strand DNA-binding protein